jgi:hypothetical protein
MLVTSGFQRGAKPALPKTAKTGIDAVTFLAVPHGLWD